MIGDITVSFYIGVNIHSSSGKWAQCCAVAIMPDPEITWDENGEELEGKQVTSSPAW